jgi:hypothetical protein
MAIRGPKPSSPIAFSCSRMALNPGPSERTDSHLQVHRICLEFDLSEPTELLRASPSNQWGRRAGGHALSLPPGWVRADEVPRLDRKHPTDGAWHVVAALNESTGLIDDWVRRKVGIVESCKMKATLTR